MALFVELKSLYTKHRSQPPADTMLHGGFCGGVVVFAAEYVGGWRVKEGRNGNVIFIAIGADKHRGALKFQHSREMEDEDGKQL